MPEETKKCPYCAEEIKADAIKCKHCGHILQTPESGEKPPLDATFIQAVCPKCGKAHQLHPSHEGKEFHCDCSEVIKVPLRDQLAATESADLAQAETLPVPGPSGTEDSIEIVSEEPGEKKGILFADRYRIIRKLGEGGVGAVYLAHDETLDVDVAFKVLKGEDFAEEEDIERFIREARAAAKLNHPNIARVLNAGTYEHSHHFIAMEFIDGMPLDKFLGLSRIVRTTEQPELETPKPKFDDRQVTQLFAQVVDALAYAHKNGIVHRDIKPGNVMVDKEGKAVLTDFGLAKQIRGEKVKTVTRTGWIMGTASYMSPEQAQGRSGRVTPASDVFGFGAMMYHVFCRRLPFDGEGLLEILRAVLVEEPRLPRRIRSSIHPDMDAIIMKCLEKSPARRYRNGGELAADLKRFLGGESVIARPLSSLRQILRRLKRKKAFVSSIAAIVLAVLIVVGVFTYREIERSQEQRQAREQAAAFVKNARTALREGECEKALSLVSKSLTLVPDSDDALSLKAECEAMLAERKRKQEARRKAEQLLSRVSLLKSDEEKLETVDRAIAEDSTCVTAYIEKAKLLRMMFRDEDAIRVLRTAARVAENQNEPEKAALVYYQMGLTRFGQGDYDKAGRYFEKIVELLPNVDNLMTRIAHGLAELREAHFAEALIWFNKALEISPGMAEIYFIRSKSYFGEMDFDRAIADSLEVIKLNPNLIAAYTSVAFLRQYMKLDKDGADTIVREGLEQVNKLITAMPDRAGLRIRRTDLKVYMKDFDGALQDCDKAIELSPSLINAYAKRAFCKYMKRDYTGALKDNMIYIELLLEMSGEYPMYEADIRNAWDLRLNYRNSAQNYDGAIEETNKLIEFYPGVGYFQRARVKSHFKNRKGAIEDYTKAISIEPLEVYYSYRAAAKAADGDFKGALADYTRAIELNPGNWSGYFARARAQIKVSKYDDAIKDLKKSAELNPDNPLIFYQYARIFAVQKKRNEMLTELQKAIQHHTLCKLWAREEKSFEQYRDDPDFKRLVGE